MALAYATFSAPADVLDDAGLTWEDLLVGRTVTPRSESDGLAAGFAGLPLSPEHEAELLAGFQERERGPFDWRSFQAEVLESRGQLAKALELARAEHRPLDELRLLLRSGGNADEATSGLAGMDAAKPGGTLQGARTRLMAACRPLEDGEQWELLDKYLGILRKQLPQAHWQGAIWLEELDIAYHRGRLPELKAAAEGDKMKLALYHRQMGETEESERLVQELAAEPGRQLADLLPLFPQSAALRTLSFARWQEKDLAVEERLQLWEQLQSYTAFSGPFIKWVTAGGDLTPLLDSVAKSWVFLNDSPERQDMLEAIHRRLPEDLRFSFMLARQVMGKDPARAAELFAAVAVSPLRAGLPLRMLSEVYPVEVRSPRELMTQDPAMLGFAGLASLNRQDKIRKIIDASKDWPTLPAVDRARYLAAADMDHALVALVMDADLTQPESDGLASWLAAVLKQRGRERVIPRELYQKIAARLPELVTGSPQKDEQAIESDAGDLMGLLKDSALKMEDLKGPGERTLQAAAGRPGRTKRRVEFQAAATGFPVPRSQEDKPQPQKEEGPQPQKQDREPRRIGGPPGARMELGLYLAMLAPPGIERLEPIRSPGRDIRFRRPPGAWRGQRFGQPETLTRWAMNLPMMGMGAPYQKPELLAAMMKTLPAGHPRRILAEVSIAAGQIPCKDEALKAECEATAEALVTGKLKLPGTETYRYFSLLGREGEDDALMAVLEEIKRKPRLARMEFLDLARMVQMDYRRGGRPGDPLAKALNEISQPGIAGPQEDNADALKLSELVEAGKGKTPEALRLARVLMDRAVDRMIEAARAGDISSQQRPRFTGGSDPQMPVQVLDAAGELTAWKDEASRKMRTGGLPDVAILRMVQTCNRYRQQSDPASEAQYARWIFELDPADRESARVVLNAALEDRDREQVLKCMRTLGLGDFGSTRVRQLLAIFAGQEAALLDGIMSSGDSGRSSSLERPIPQRLHAFFMAAEDKGLAKRFRDWIGNNRQSQPETRVALARQLLAAGDPEGAVDVFAGIFVVAAEFDGAPWVFPPKPGTRRGSRSTSLDISQARDDVEFLSEQGLVGRMLERIERSGQAEGIESVTLRMAAKPDREAFGKYAAGLLATMDPMDRGRLLSEWFMIFTAVPGAEELQVRLMEEQIATPGRTGFPRSAMLGVVVRLPGGSSLLEKAWTRLSADMEQKDSRGGGTTPDQTGRGIFAMMLTLADDATWNDYWKWRDADAESLLPASMYWRELANIGKIPTERLRQVLPRLLRESPAPKVGQREGIESAAAVWAGAALESGDEALIRQAKAALPPGSAEYVALCDLALGTSTELSPSVAAMSGEDGELTVSWSLVSLSGVDEGQPAKIPLAAFPKLEGKFEVQVLGGRSPEQLTKLQVVPGAPVLGSVTLKPGDEVSHIGLMVTQPGGGQIRWALPVPRPASGGKTTEVAGAVLEKKGFSKMPRPGPGGLPAWRIESGGMHRIELAELPWDGEPVRVRGWFRGSDNLMLSCLDARGTPLKHISLRTYDSAVPVWRILDWDSAHGENVPPATTRIVLGLEMDGVEKVRSFATPGMKLSLGGEAGLPQGFRRIGRVPGQGWSMALESGSKRLAIGLTGGRVALMNVDTGAFEMMGESPTIQDEGDQAAIQRLLWAGGMIYAADGGGALYRIDPAAGKLVLLQPGSSAGRTPHAGSSLCVSEDGAWLGWLKNGQTLMLMPVQGGPPREIAVVQSHQLFAAPEGFRLIGQRKPRMVLKNEDMAEGLPVESDVNEQEWEGAPNRKNPRWEHLSLGGYQPPRRERQGREVYTSIPAERCYLIAPDDTIYYADRNGVVVEVKPLD